MTQDTIDLPDDKENNFLYVILVFYIFLLGIFFFKSKGSFEKTTYMLIKLWEDTIIIFETHCIFRSHSFVQKIDELVLSRTSTTFRLHLVVG